MSCTRGKGKMMRYKQQQRVTEPLDGSLDFNSDGVACGLSDHRALEDESPGGKAQVQDASRIAAASSFTYEFQRIVAALERSVAVQKRVPWIGHSLRSSAKNNTVILVYMLQPILNNSLADSCEIPYI